MANTLDQDRTFCFCLVTATSIQYFFFEWKEPNHPLQMRLLNTVCGWGFVHEWHDDEFSFPTGKIIRQTENIKTELRQVREEFLQNKVYQKHKQHISRLVETISSLENDELFFIYRIVYSMPSHAMLYRICTELQYIKQGKSKEDADCWFYKEAAPFYKKYNIYYYKEFKQGEKNRNKRICRFCGKRMPEVTFDKDAHVIPESIGGSKNMLCYEECDSCNEEFGKGIEQNLCNWFDFRRSKYGIRKKKGGIANAYGENYVIENTHVSLIDTYKQEGAFKALASCTVTLQGIYRALCKIAIDLIDSEHLPRLQTTIKWIRTGNPKSKRYPQIAQMDHLPSVQAPFVYIFTRKDNLDKDDAPLYFCILRIFDLAFLYTLPHVDGKIYYTDDYTKRLPLEALKTLGFSNGWTWESYNTTEERKPHVWLDFSKASIKPLDTPQSPPIEKLRKEKAPDGYTDFPKPKLTAKDILSCELKRIELKEPINDENIKYCIGDVLPKVVIDVRNRLPLVINLLVLFEDTRTMTQVAEISYTLKIAAKAYKSHINITSSSIYPNPELFVQILEFAIEFLFRDLLKLNSSFPFTRENLNFCDCRELLDKITFRFIR